MCVCVCVRERERERECDAGVRTVLGGVVWWMAVCPPVGVVGRNLYGNKLSGSIPVELGRLTALTFVYEALLFLCGE